MARQQTIFQMNKVYEYYFKASYNLACILKTTNSSEIVPCGWEMVINLVYDN